MLHIPFGPCSAARVFIPESCNHACAVIGIEDISSSIDRVVVGLNLDTCQLVVHPIANIWVANLAGGGILMGASPHLIVAHSEYRVPAA